MQPEHNIMLEDVRSQLESNLSAKLNDIEAAHSITNYAMYQHTYSDSSKNEQLAAFQPSSTAQFTSWCTVKPGEMLIFCVFSLCIIISQIGVQYDIYRRLF
uniref:Uncharacterized protein n=1 Tax=Cacopsylla melanoneura TaxID=428564 RepID=A0A8D9BSY9_9HEMI